MVRGKQSEQVGGGRGAEAAPEPFAASAGPHSTEVEAGSGLPSAVTCLLAAALAFALPILAVQLLYGSSPGVVQQTPVASQLQSMARPAAIQPVYRVHMVPEVHFPAIPSAAVCEPEP